MPAQIRISHSPSFSLLLSAGLCGLPTLCILTVKEPIPRSGPSHHWWHVSCVCSKLAFLPFCEKNKLKLDPNKHDRKNNNPCRGLIPKMAGFSTHKAAPAVDRSRSPSLVPGGRARNSEAQEPLWHSEWGPLGYSFWGHLCRALSEALPRSHNDTTRHKHCNIKPILQRSQ